MKILDILLYLLCMAGALAAYFLLTPPLSLVAIWEASSTGIREIACTHELPGDEEHSVELLVQLAGEASRPSQSRPR